MQHDAPGSAGTRGMLKSYKKESRWYPTLEPTADGAGSADAQGDTTFGDDDSPARFPYYIREDEAELVIPPIPESVLRRSHFNGAWSDWMTDRESTSYTPKLRYRESTVVDFPWESEEDGAQKPKEQTDVASALLDAIDDAAPAPAGRYTRRRLFVVLFLIVAVLLLAIAGAVALYALNSHSGTSQSIGTLEGDARSGPSARVSAYNEMTNTVVIGDHIPAGISVG